MIHQLHANTVFNDYNAANKKSFVLAKLISRINAQSKLNTSSTTMG
jgi:hypothetical protein